MNPFVLDLLVKVTLILAIGLSVAAIVRQSAPSLRHLVLFATVASSLVLPVVMGLSPRWDVPLLSSSLSRTSVSPGSGPLNSPMLQSLQAAGSRAASAINVASQSSGAPTSPAIESGRTGSLFGKTPRVSAVALIWMLGFSVVIAWLVVGRIKLRRIGRASWALNTDDWAQILREECLNAAVSESVQLCSSPVVSTPLTWGWRAPVILLPEDAIDWPEDHRRIVLRHELAHVARNDALSQLFAGFACAFYWFHPVVWFTERRLRAECERACDDRVVSQGTPAAEYAAHLLEVARSARAFGAPGFLSVAMARPSQLEGRLLAVLNGSRQRVSLSRAARPVAIALSLLVLLPLAAFRPVSKATVVPKVNVPAPTKVAKSPQPARKPAIVMARPSSVNSTTIEYSLDSTFDLSALVRSGGTLDLDLKTGANVTISGSDRSNVSVRASLGGRDWRGTQVKLVTTDDGARLESYFRTSSNNQSTRHRFDISVPHNFNVHVRSAGGSVEIENVTGNFTGNTGGGEINLRGAGGHVDLSTGGGDIYVSDSKLSGHVSTGGGMVRLLGNNGNLKGTSGSGPVMSSNSTSEASAESGSSKSETSKTTYITNDGRRESVLVSGGIRMVSAGGAISVPSAPEGAYVTTGGGRIRIGPSGGEVHAHTGGGDIEVGPASGSVEAFTGAGDVRIELKGADSHTVGVTSGKGDVDLILPPNLNATLELETAYTNNFGRKTRISGDWPVSVTETPDWDDSHGTPRRYVRVRQNIGRGGAVIRVRTVNGDITLRRGS
jgi:beta-lactamase regulating signal transducer with metallopeptidase domain/DUF4097 and DUF4098 domain-containing protein YvlB